MTTTIYTFTMRPTLRQRIAEQRRQRRQRIARRIVNVVLWAASVYWCANLLELARRWQG